MDYIKEIENEINKMSIEELLFLKLNPNYYVYNKLKPQIEQIKKKKQRVQSKLEELENVQAIKENEDMRETTILKDKIEKLNYNIKNLLEEKDKLSKKIPKNEFLNALNYEIKVFNNPDSCFARFKDKKINFEQFEKEYAELGKGKNYYYYKLIYDRIKEDNK